MALVMLSITLNAQSEEVLDHIREGNRYYRDEQYNPAANEYSKALQLDPNNKTAKFNLANAMYKLNNQQEASKSYREIAAYTAETGLKSNAYYNQGVIETKQKKLEESIESYKNALRQNPDHKEARENLQKALLELKKQNQQNQDQKQQQKKQNQSMNQREADQRLKQLQQKEKEVQERINKEKSKSGGGTGKDW
jgi:tetratricopeptide (TPR) repeat protein